MTPLQQWAARHGVSESALAELATIYRPGVAADDDRISESGVQQRLRVEAPKVGGALWRNNSGALQDADGRMVRYGLGNDSKRLNEVWKSSDLIGGTSVRIMPHHVGRIMAILTAVEVKPGGWKGPKSDHEHAQAAFHLSVEGLGGMGLFATCVEDYHARVAMVRA